MPLCRLPIVSILLSQLHQRLGLYKGTECLDPPMGKLGDELLEPTIEARYLVRTLMEVPTFRQGPIHSITVIRMEVISTRMRTEARTSRGGMAIGNTCPQIKLNILTSKLL